MALEVYNTLSRRKEVFEPLNPPHVGMYVCGPTVYGHAHLGHAKSYISFDMILRYLRYRGYDVLYVQNITDVGHLTDDTAGMADEGEDKIVREAKRQRRHPMALAETFTRSYFEDMDALNVVRPDISPRATGHIPEQIALVQRLLAKSVAYESNGSVYFDVAKCHGYGKLSRRSVEEMEAGARVEVSGDKRHPADFALWKKAEPGHILQWDSPWGRGYPGWHLECSVMSMKYLGESFDIHGGGMENQFPHHECEIAQAETATGKPFVKYWIHHNMVTVDGQKMGKSLGNFIHLKQLFSGDHPRLSKGFEPLVVRQFVLSSHYRSPQDFSSDALEAAESGYQKLRAAVTAARERARGAGEAKADGAAGARLAEVRGRFEKAMDDDFNTAVALSVLFELARDVGAWETRKLAPGAWKAVAETFDRLGGDVLGIVPARYAEDAGPGKDALDPVVQLCIEMRATAKKAKDFATADAIRDKLRAAGIQLEDGANSTTWRKT
jgi:cysteinyl-tRNA synthetase